MSKTTVIVMGAKTHIALLELARDKVIGDAATMTNDEALSVVYTFALVEEMIAELKHTDSGAAAIERALGRVAEHGLVSFAFARNLVYDPAPETKQ